MNVTPPNSGAASPHGPSSLPTANSSLADFLLAGTSTNFGQDFRQIAAALFGLESTTASPAQAAAQKPAPGKKSAASPQEEGETHKSKETEDPSSAAAHPELTIPLPVVPTPLLNIAATPVLATGPSSLPDIKAVLKDAAMFAGRVVVDHEERRADATSGQASTPAEKPETITPPVALNEQDKQELTVVEGDVQTELPPARGDDLALVERMATSDGVARAKDFGARLFASPEASMAAKKTTADGSDQPQSSELAKQVSTQATGPTQPGPPTHAPVAVNPTSAMPPAAASLSSAALLEATSAASASKILDKSMTTGPAHPSGPVDSNLPTGLSDGSLRPTPAASPKSKDREMKDRGIKDTKSASAQQGKMSPTEAGNFADGLTKSVATNGKDVAGVDLGAHSDSHAKATPLKQAVATPSSQAAVAETDGPDEALPTSTPSPVTTAKLVHDMSQSEFRVGMQSEEFGNIDIRTSVARHMFSAQISVEHSDVAKSMTADLPALYHKLADQQVPVASIVIQGQSFATSSGLAQDSQQPQTWRPQSYNVTKSEAETALPMLLETLDSGGRLDIRI